ncbi:MAG TPA: hypothetical protein VHW47_05965 [Acidimicrobiales bacterium]|nr:hypothetical protein [Acidimicrobiales bacterium]
MARAQGVSRAEVVRRLVDRGLDDVAQGDLEADLAAIDDAFGISAAEDFEVPTRQPDDRARHLGRVGRR